MSITESLSPMADGPQGSGHIFAFIISAIVVNGVAFLGYAMLKRHVGDAALVALPIWLLAMIVLVIVGFTIEVIHLNRRK